MYYVCVCVCVCLSFQVGPAEPVWRISSHLDILHKKTFNFDSIEFRLLMDEYLSHCVTFFFFFNFRGDKNNV